MSSDLRDSASEGAGSVVSRHNRGGPRPGPSADLQQRTLRVTNFHEDVTKDLLTELFMQVGPVKNVVLRSDHAFVEFQHEESVGYALAMMSDVELFSVRLHLEPKLSSPESFKYMVALQNYQSMMGPPGNSESSSYDDHKNGSNSSYKDHGSRNRNDRHSIPSSSSHSSYSSFSDRNSRSYGGGSNSYDERRRPDYDQPSNQYQDFRQPQMYGRSSSSNDLQDSRRHDDYSRGRDFNTSGSNYNEQNGNERRYQPYSRDGRNDRKAPRGGDNWRR